MGVQPLEEEAFQEEPETPPGLRGQPKTTDQLNEDDLFSDTGTTTTTTTTTPVFKFNPDIDFRSIIPVLPAKGIFEDFLGRVDHRNTRSENKKYCSNCFEDVKRDLKKLAEVVDSFKIERDSARKENEVLKKEIEELKTLVRELKELENGSVKVNISDGKGNVDVLVRDKNFGNKADILNPEKKSDNIKKFGILSFTINLQNGKTSDKTPPSTQFPKIKSKKTVADLRREFFAKEFESQQKTFTASNYLEIKPEEKKETFRSKLNIRVKPRKKISEIISKLTARISAPKTIPDSTPITMFQRFEKTKTVWESELEERPTV